MKIPALFALGATIWLAPTLAHAQPRPPALNPALQNQAAQRAQQSDVLYWYNLLPANIFGAFGKGDRVDLLKSQGATYDKNRGYIEVFAPGDPNENDVEKLQVKLYKGQQSVMVGVSQIVWNQPRVQGALAFFALNNEGRLFPVTRQVFPYDLTPAQPAAPAANATDQAADKTAAAPVNAYLPRNGTTITAGVAEAKKSLADYSWNNQVFVERRAPADKAPANNAPADKAPANTTPANNSPADNAPTDQPE